MNNVIGRRVHCYEEMQAPGDFLWTGCEAGDQPPGRLMFICPCGCGMTCGIAIAGDRTLHPVWDWNGDFEKPSVNPSIRMLSGCQWHGYLTDGVFRSC